MCVIVTKPRNLVVPWDTFKTCFERNSDGAGFTAVSRRGQMHHVKGLMTFDAFKEAFEPHAKSAALVHFRIRTHGETNEEMTHPFEITPQLHVAHNGTIPISTKNDPSKSDTWHFVEYVLKPELEADPSCLSRPSYIFLLAECIGYSKLAFIQDDGEIFIVNRQKGEEGTGDLKGCWFSNSTYKPVVYTPTNWGNQYSRSAGTTPLLPAVTPIMSENPFDVPGSRITAWAETQGVELEALVLQVDKLRRLGYTPKGIVAILDSGKIKISELIAKEEEKQELTSSL